MSDWVPYAIVGLFASVVIVRVAVRYVSRRRQHGRGPAKRRPAGPDFSSVDSREKAEDLCRGGTLVRLMLLPRSFGGKDIAENVVYVPSWVEQEKRRIDENIVRPQVAEGKTTRYRATPEYEGKSFVPIAIHVCASNTGRLEASIEIWGEALRRDLIITSGAGLADGPPS